MLYEKLSNQFKDQLVIVRKTENLNNLIMLIYNIDANMKKINKQFQLRIKPNTSNFPAIKLLFMSYNLTRTKPSTTVGVVVVSSVPSPTIKTYSSPMNISNVIRQDRYCKKKRIDTIAWTFAITVTSQEILP